MRILAALLAALLSACNALGGIPPQTIDAIASAGGGCVAVESLLMGKGVMMVGSADKGVIRNGSVSVAAGCGGISISNTTVPPVAPIK